MYSAFQTSLSLFTFAILLATSSAQNTTCESTGHRCIFPEQCASESLANGQYQWCGGCQRNVRCQGGVGDMFDFYNPSFTQWDDNRKNYEATSTTCVECYYPCPPGPSAPEQPVCDRTGLGCLTNTCPSGVNGNFQYCGNCTHYATCSISAGLSLVACPQGAYYDDVARTCLPSSTTCRQCYDTCYEPTTVEPTTVQPTTVQAETSPEGADHTGDPNPDPTDGENGSTTRGGGGSGADQVTTSVSCFSLSLIALCTLLVF